LCKSHGWKACALLWVVTWLGSFDYYKHLISKCFKSKLCVRTQAAFVVFAKHSNQEGKNHLAVAGWGFVHWVGGEGPTHHYESGEQNHLAEAGWGFAHRVGGEGPTRINVKMNIVLCMCIQACLTEPHSEKPILLLNCSCVWESGKAQHFNNFSRCQGSSLRSYKD
jgi:hypothetical protein